MSSSSIDPALANPAHAIQDSLSDFELMKLSGKLKPCTWIIKVCHQQGGEVAATYHTGFALKVDKYALKNSIEENDIVLMTCAHALNNKSRRSIKVRRLEDENFNLEAKVRFLKTNWDIALLVVKGAAKGVNHDIFGEFADDGSIVSCETLLQVGHLGDLVWSVFIGRAAYPCAKSFIPSGCDESEPFGRATCGSYVSNSLNTTPIYRILGDMWNANYFETQKEIKHKFEKSLCALIPIIQCVGFSCIKDGCYGSSGGPVFNTQGKIVGMIIGQNSNCQIAIHVTVLEEFIEHHLTTANEVYEKEKKPVVGGHDSKDAKLGKSISQIKKAGKRKSR